MCNVMLKYKSDPPGGMQEGSAEGGDAASEPCQGESSSQRVRWVPAPPAKNLHSTSNPLLAVWPPKKHLQQPPSTLPPKNLKPIHPRVDIVPPAPITIPWIPRITSTLTPSEPPEPPWYSSDGLWAPYGQPPMGAAYPSVIVSPKPSPPTCPSWTLKYQ